MKKIKQFIALLLIATTVFFSCSTNEEAENVQKSAALRLFLKEVKVANNINGRAANNANLCFEFVYPLTLSYSNGTTVSVANEQDLITVLENESSSLYIDGIAFPFQIVLSGSTTPVTIATETEFWDVLTNCDIATYDDYIVSGPCYSFVYPFSLITSTNQTIVLNNEQELFALFQTQNEGNYIVDFVYPFTVNYNNSNIQINNEYEFSTLNSNCTYSNCDCPTVIDPICVSVGSVVIEFPSACLAECAGFTSADFVDCNSNGNGSPFEALLSSCLSISFPVQVMQNGQTATVANANQLLELYNADAGIFPNFSYPIVVSFQSNPNQTYSIANEEGLIEAINLHCN